MPVALFTFLTFTPWPLTLSGIQLVPAYEGHRLGLFFLIYYFVVWKLKTRKETGRHFCSVAVPLAVDCIFVHEAPISHRLSMQFHCYQSFNDVIQLIDRLNSVLSPKKTGGLPPTLGQSNTKSSPTDEPTCIFVDIHQIQTMLDQLTRTARK